MRIRQLVHAAMAAVLVTATLLTGGMRTQAAETRYGTLTLAPRCDGAAVDASYDGTFDLYRVADLDLDTETVTVTTAFRRYDDWQYLTWQNLTSQSTFQYYGQSLGNWIRSHSEIAVATDQDHKALAEVHANEQRTLSHGVYLVVQHTKGTGYQEAEAFLAFVPTLVDHEQVTNVTVHPKLTKESTPDPGGPDTPTPSDPGSPSDPGGPVSPGVDTDPKGPKTPQTTDSANPTEGTTTTPTRVGRVTLTKVDADDGHVLAEASFILYKTGDKVVGTYTTDANGIITIESLPWDDYYFVETAAPNGYTLDATPHAFTIGEGANNVALQITNSFGSSFDAGEGRNATGDDSSIGVYAGLAALAALTLTGWCLRRKAHM